MSTRKTSRTVWSLTVVVMAMLVLTMTSATWADIILKVDFNSSQDGGGDSTTAGDPSLSAAAHNQDGWSSYHANHEVIAEFTTADYDGITVTPAWPNTTANTVQQSIDRGSGNDSNWDDAAGDLNLVTDWIGIDTRTGNGGNGDWDGTTGTPTYMTLTLGGLNAGTYNWTSFHHDTENVWGPFAVWLSTDGGATFEQLDDGIMTDSTSGGSPDSGATEAGPDVYTLPSTYHTSFVANGTDDVVFRWAPYSAPGVHREIWGMNGFVLELASSDKAYGPTPVDGATDVLTSVVLNWNPADDTAATDGHKVFLSSDLAAVTDGVADAEVGVVSNPEFDAAQLPFTLEYGMTYYWRVDNASTPGGPWTAGSVWSFTVEPYAIPIPGSAVAVTASSSSGVSLPEKMIDGSGLTDNMHSTNQDDMWLSATPDLNPWIAFEFDNVQKLDHMAIWNSNSSSEAFIGWGIKDVNVETSVDGVAWTALAETSQVAKATGLDTYGEPQVIDLGLAVAKYVRLNILSNWGGLLMQYGVSEVQFYGLPVYAREPMPESGSVDVPLDSDAGWRAGREASQHVLYVDTDMNAVTDGTVPSVTASANAVSLESLDLHLGQTYYWRVDEVNNAENPSVWAGPVWNLSTPAVLVVDDFESYSNKSPNRPFQTWLDGYGYSADDFFPVDYPGNGTGSGIGHDIWSPGSPYFGGTIMETTIVYDGSQSLPLYYNNSAGGASETTRTFAEPQDWTTGGIQSLSLMVQGSAGNVGQLYLKINNTRVNGAPDISQAGWQAWIIDLSAVAGNLQNVTSLTIGVEGAGAEGMLYIDEIRLYPKPGETIVPEEPSTDGLVAYFSFDEGSGATAADGSGNNNYGDVVGDAQWVAGKVGGALAFDGVDDMVVVNQNSGLPIYNNGTDNAYSIAMWVKGGPQNDMRIFSEGSTSSNTPLLNLGTHNSATPTGQFATYIRPDTGTTSNHPLSQAEPFDDSWHHIVWVDENGTASVYIDGLRDVGDFDYTRGTMALDTTSIGGILRAAPSHWFTGQIDEVRIYNRTLSAGEVLGLAGKTQPIDKPFE